MTIVVKDGKNPVAGADVQISRSVRFDGEDLIVETGKTNTAGSITTDKLTPESLRGGTTFYARAGLRTQDGAILWGGQQDFKFDGRGPDRIELLLDPVLRTCVPPCAFDESTCLCASQWPCEQSLHPCGECSEIRKPLSFSPCNCVNEEHCARSVLECYRRIPKNSSLVSYASEATLIVTVPADATVFINGRPTTSTGEQRVYLSKGLAYGYSYRYLVRVQTKANGQVREDTREVVLRPGETKTVSFVHADKN